MQKKLYFGLNYYIQGTVRVTVEGASKEQEVATMTRGQFFGEIALIKEDLRTANVYAKTQVSCYVLERQAFTSLIGNLNEAKYTKENQVDKTVKRIINPLVKKFRLLHSTMFNLVMKYLSEDEYFF